MTDSMKFGPEWLRNMSADSTNPGLGSGGGGNSGGGNNSSGGGGSNTNNSSLSSSNIISGGLGGSHHNNSSGPSSHAPAAAPRNMFPEFRYGREEMLSLFDKNCPLPEILPWYKKIFVDKAQYPLALTPSTEDEMLTQGPAVPTQRPAWMQRSPVGFSSSIRGTGRGGSVDRGRMRGKSVYHPIFQRPTAMFEDDLRPTLLKSERGWSERNGAGDSLGIGGASGSGAGAVGALGTDWNGTPVSSPRKEFSSHPRNMENWRRNRNEDGSGDASTSGSGVSGLANTDGWRGGSSSATSFGSTHRWGRSTSWRDEENPHANADGSSYGTGGGSGGVGPAMQRSYSTISTTVAERNSGAYISNSLSKSASQTSANYLSGGSNSNTSRTLNSSSGGGGGCGGSIQSLRNNQWPMNSSGGGLDPDEKLPEWAIETPSDSGGTFDASGAFHDSAADRDSNSGGDSGGKEHQTSTKQQRKKSSSSSIDSTSRGGSTGEESNYAILEKNTSTPEKGTTGSGGNIAFNDSIPLGHNLTNEAAQQLSPNRNNSTPEDLPATYTKQQQEELQEPNPNFAVQSNNNNNKIENTTASMSSMSSSMSSSASSAAASLLTSVTNLNYFHNDTAATPLAKSQTAIATNTAPSSDIVVAPSSAHNDFSDRMKAVADDMVEKLIMDSDDDANKCVATDAITAKSTTITTNTTTSSVTNLGVNQQQNAFVNPALAAILKQSAAAAATAAHQTEVASPTTALPSSIAAAVSKGGAIIPLYGGGVVVDHATMQQHQHQVQQQQLTGSNAGVPVTGLPPHHHALSPNPAASADLWYYRDPQAKVQGPFTAVEMTEWYRAGYFNENLFVRRVCDTRFRALGELTKVCLGNMPFTHSHLIPMGGSAVNSGLDNLHLTNTVSVGVGMPPPPAQMTRSGEKIVLNDYGLKQLHQSEQHEELKGNVTAAADSLSAAVKNLISSVDMTHMLNLHFQMLQDQYLRHQEMMVVAELSNNECFQRLTPPEREAVVRQKVQIHGLPEYLTSLSGLSNSLATLNPAAGNQLYDAIAECSKKDQQQHHMMQQQQQQSNVIGGGGAANMKTFLDADDFIINSAPQQPPIHTFPNSPYTAGALLRSGGDNSNAGGNSSGGNEFNMSMFLRGAGGNTAQQQAVQQQHQMKTQDFLAAAGANDFITEQQLLAAAAAAANAQSPMLQMWMPQLAAAAAVASSAVTASSPPHPQILSQHQQHPQQNNQWAGGPLVGIPSAVIASGVGQPKASMPTSMWDVTPLEQGQQQHQQHQLEQQQQQQHNIMTFDTQKTPNLLQPLQPKEQQQQQQQSQKQQRKIVAVVENFTELQAQQQSAAFTEKQQVDAAGIVSLQQQQPTSSAAVMNNKQRKDDSTDNSKFNLNKRNKLQQQQQPQSSFTAVAASKNNKDNDNSALNRKNEEERRREIAEEKRRQKEERKRLQLEEDKRRQQQHEEEKRRQMLEEKERQQQIQAQRRKAMLGGGGANTVAATSAVSPSAIVTATGGITSTAVSSSSGGNKSNRGGGVQSSIAPWSTQNTAAATSAAIKTGPPPCLAEIQKAERRERRADQQRQMEQLERQIRATAAAAEANDLMLKWNASPVPPVAVKSFAEIQAEEAKRLAAEQLEMQRRREQEQHQSALAAATAAAGSIPLVAGGAGGGVSGTGNNNIAAIWGGTKVWGGATATNTNTAGGGFWEEQSSIKFSAAATAANSTAAAIAASQQHVAPHQTGGNASRNLRKSQTVSIMQNTVASQAAKNYQVKGNNSSAQMQQQSLNTLKQQQQQQGNKLQHQQQQQQKSDADKKASGKSQNNNGGSGGACLAPTTANKRGVDDFENEFTGWCTKSLNNMNTKVDVPTFVTFLQDLESPYEVKDYIRMYLGESKEYTEFSKQFLERRSKYKNLQRAQNAHNDDMCKPAPAITPSGNENSDSKGKQKKVNKKNKMTKLDARILGFSVTAAEGRINVGDRDYVDAP